MEKTRNFTTDEMFCANSELKYYFKDLDRRIKALAREEGKEEELAKLKKRKKDLLETARYMCVSDLEMIYYLRNLRHIMPQHILNGLKRLYTAQEEIYAFIKKGEIPQE